MAAPSDPPAEAAAPPPSPRLHNLPAQPTPLIGRDETVEVLRQRLLRADVRLLTLTGPPGTGKTRLAHAVAAELVDDFEHGVWFVRLESVRDPDEVPAAIAQVLGQREEGTRALLETVAAHLAERRLLLVLDNFEQVLAAGEYVAELLGACPRVKVLVTSRAALRLRWEHEAAVTPLALPDQADGATPDAIEASPAVQLFVQRAQAVLPDFRLTEQNSGAVAAICARLDGLPLALELAAARMKLFSPPLMLQRLEQRLGVLTGGPVDLPARHRTLRAAVDWSYDLLSPAERATFRRLGSFVGGCTVEAAEAIVALREAGAPGEGDTLGVLDALLNQSLLRREEQPSGELRLWMLESVRELALEHLVASGELDAAARRHAEFFLALAEAAEPKLAGPEQGAWLTRLEAEHDNLRAALAWAVAQGEVETGLRLGGALWRFWNTRGHLTEGRRHLATLLALPGAAGHPALRAKALNGAGNLAMFQGDYDAARALHEQSLELRRELGRTRDVASSLNNLGIIAQLRGEYADAQRIHEESLDVKRGLGDRSGIAYSLTCLGNLALEQGDYVAARALHEEALAIRRELGDEWGIRISLNNLGNVAYFCGEFAAARRLLLDALAIAQASGDRVGIGYALYNLGASALREGDGDSACSYLKQSLSIFRALGDMRSLGFTLEAWAALAVSERLLERAARLFGAAEAIRDRVGVAQTVGERALHDRDVAAMRAALDDATIAATWAAGRAMPLEAAVAFALSDDAAGPSTSDGGLSAAATPSIHTAATLPDGLSAREVEVLALIAAGHSNRTICERLVLAEGTVERHISNIYAKIGARGRADATAYALRHGLA